jgi:hypothetical protein
MINKSFLNKFTAFAAAVLLCCSVLFIQSNAEAQCPTSAPPNPDPSTCPWSSTTVTVLMPGTTCGITIYYCCRCCLGFGAETYLTQINIDSAACSPIDPSDMIHFASDYVRDLQAVSCGVKGFPCGYIPTLSVQTYVPSCWTESALSGQYELTPCSASGCFCEKDCKACWNGSAIVYSHCTVTTHWDCVCGYIGHGQP